METWKKFIETTSLTTEVLEKYMEIRMLLKEMGHTEESIKKISTAPGKLWRLKADFEKLMKNLWHQLDGYGFDISWNDLALYFQPKFDNIDKLIPLRDGNTKRNNSRNEDNQ